MAQTVGEQRHHQELRTETHQRTHGTSAVTDLVIGCGRITVTARTYLMTSRTCWRSMSIPMMRRAIPSPPLKATLTRMFSSTLVLPMTTSICRSARTASLSEENFREKIPMMLDLIWRETFSRPPAVSGTAGHIL